MEAVGRPLPSGPLPLPVPSTLALVARLQPLKYEISSTAGRPLRGKRSDANLARIGNGTGRCVQVLQQHRQPVLGGFVLLQTGGERTVAQLIRQTLA